jgi:DNA-binding transcriptional MerR regulator
LWTVGENLNESWKLDELAKHAGVSVRTVRYYVQRGLLPAPVFRGRDTSYSGEHLLRLRAIRRLQDRFLPLDEIQSELGRRTPEELRHLVEAKEAAGTILRREPVPAAGPVERPERWTRWVLAPGLEIQISDRADAMARTLADEIKTLAERRKGRR